MRCASVAASMCSQFVAGEQCVAVDTGAGGNGARSARMIAGDHHDANSGAVAFGNCAGHLGTQRIGKTDQTDELEVEVVLDVRPVLVDAVLGLGHAQHAQAAIGHEFCIPADALPRVLGQVAKIGDRLRCALGRDHVLLARSVAPQMRHGEQFRRKFILARQRPIRMQVFRVGQVFAGKAVECELHRIVRIDFAGQHRILEQLVIGLGQIAAASLRRFQHLSGDRQRGHRHAVLGQRAGLVHAQHGRLAQRFDGVRGAVSARAALAMRRAPSARKTIMMTGNSCGRMPIASVMPASKPSSQPPRNTQ